MNKLPNWKTHLEIAKRINNNEFYKGKDKELFLIGSILPDINNMYIVKEISEKISHIVTHFDNYEMTTYQYFYKKYKDKIDSKDPLFFGYYAHLYTDYTWNNDFYTEVGRRGMIKEDKDKLRVMKQSDFKVFNNKFVDNYIKIENSSISQIVNETKKIEEIKITSNDLENVIAYLEKDVLYEENYEFYEEQYLDSLMNKTVEKIKENGIL